MTKKIPIRLKQEWNNSEVPMSNPHSLCATDNSTDPQNIEEKKKKSQSLGCWIREPRVCGSVLTL